MQFWSHDISFVQRRFEVESLHKFYWHCIATGLVYHSKTFPGSTYAFLQTAAFFLPWYFLFSHNLQSFWKTKSRGIVKYYCQTEHTYIGIQNWSWRTFEVDWCSTCIQCLLPASLWCGLWRTCSPNCPPFSGLCFQAFVSLPPLSPKGSVQFFCLM